MYCPFKTIPAHAFVTIKSDNFCELSKRYKFF